MTFSLMVKKRAAGRPDAEREHGLLPAVVYGPEREQTQPVSLDYNTFEKFYEEAGESSLIDLTIEGESEPIKVLIQDVQYDPVKRDMIHADFRQIKMGEQMYTSIELDYVNEAPAVKELGGTLVKGLDYINVKCLPKDLVSDIKVDLSDLRTFDNVIKIGDLPVPEGMEVTDNPNTVVAKVSAPLTEDQLKAMEEAEAPSVEDVEVEEKGKVEEEEESKQKSAEEQAEQKEDKEEKK